MIITKIIVGMNTPYPSCNIGGAIACVYQVTDNCIQCAGMRVGLHDGYLGPRPVQHLCTNGIPFSIIGVQQSFRRFMLDDGCELPAEVHGVAQSKVKSLASQGRMNMSSVAG